MLPRPSFPYSGIPGRARHRFFWYASRPKYLPFFDGTQRRNIGYQLRLRRKEQSKRATLPRRRGSERDDWGSFGKSAVVRAAIEGFRAVAPASARSGAIVAIDPLRGRGQHDQRILSAARRDIPGGAALRRPDD